MSSQPTVALQHPYGGQITGVYVQKHDHVSKGDLLLSLDSTLDTKALASLTQVRDQVASENDIIEMLLSHDQEHAPLDAETAAGSLILRHHQASADQNLQFSTAESLRTQAQALRIKIAKTQTQVNLLQARADRQAELVEQGLMPRQDYEAQVERLYRTQGEVQSDLANLESLEDRARQSLDQGSIVMLSLRQELTERLEINRRQLQEMEPQIAELQDRLAKSQVRAPMDGIVTETDFVAQEMFAVRGATLLTLARPLQQPQVSFMVPVAQIDQLKLGMSGQLAITSLPQRSMPQIRATVTAISPRAAMDEAGNPMAYAGLAQIGARDFEILRSALGDVALSEDMPVSLAVEAQETTLAQYLVAPFFAAFENALQD